MTLNGKTTSGSVTSFAGATGLLQALLDFVSGTKLEDQATAGSSVGPYTDTLSTPVGLGSVLMKYTISGLDYTARDDGVGAITGDYIDSASINYDTGALTVTLTTTPDANPTYDYVYGEDGGDWEVKINRNTRNGNKTSPSEPFGSNCKEVILHNRGLSGAENILIGIREWQYVAANASGWDLTGFTSYSDGMYFGRTFEDLSLTYDTTWNCFENAPKLPLIDDTIYYWFFSNRQRIIVIAKVQSNYESIYLGFANRYGNPEDYPYPLVIKGSLYGKKTITETSEASHAFIPYSTTSGTNMLHNVLPDGSWSLNWGAFSSNYATILFPVCNWNSSSRLLSETPNKKEVLLSPVMSLSLANNSVLHELDGVLHAAGVGVQSEDEIRGHDGIKYLAFQNISRIDYDDFMGVANEDYTSTSTTTTTTTTTTLTTTTTE